MRGSMFRIGHGFDVHKIEPHQGGHIPLCGIKIPCNFKVIAHSDGDVALHAVVDAMLGAMALGDIGDHFPPSDEKWRGADSKIFVAHALKLIGHRNASLVNLDITVLAEQPKLKSFKQSMKENLSSMLGIPNEYINIKATTTEKLGFVGREEGIAVEAVCLVKVG